MRLQTHATEGSPGFQIAPMIDVVFVIMLFFMVMAGEVKVERELSTTLPGNEEANSTVTFIDEIIIGISEAGEVTLNEDPIDSPQSTELPQLKGTLMKMKQNSEASKTPAVVTIVTEENAKYSRTIDVLNALASARFENVTFTVSEQE